MPGRSRKTIKVFPFCRYRRHCRHSHQHWQAAFVDGAAINQQRPSLDNTHHASVRRMCALLLIVSSTSFMLVAWPPRHLSNFTSANPFRSPYPSWLVRQNTGAALWVVFQLRHTLFHYYCLMYLTSRQDLVRHLPHPTTTMHPFDGCVLSSSSSPLDGDPSSFQNQEHLADTRSSTTSGQSCLSPGRHTTLATSRAPTLSGFHTRCLRWQLRQTRGRLHN